MPNAECKELGIPDHLHKDNRAKDLTFEETEVLYRRFNVSGKPEDWKNDKQLSLAVFEIKDDSFNRSKYSSPDDVLYNDRKEDKGVHYTNHGILSIPSSLSSFDFYIDEKKDEKITRRTFSINVEHTPKECNYSHCEIFVFENGQKIDSGKPKSVKLAVRSHLVDNTKIIKIPD